MIYGRESEIGRIAALLDAVRAGAGGALVLEGDPGIGKTALLGQAIAEATGMRQLRVTGLEAESSLPFAALAELAEHLLDELSGLPAPQARAIEGALALAPPAKSDRFAVCAGFLGLLVGAAAEQPLLLAIDDAQWLDRASAECLGYAARRLAGHSIGLLAAARTGAPHPFTGRAIERIELTGLDDEAAWSLLEARGASLPDPVARSLLAAAAGNPMALIELPSQLSESQRSGEVPLEDPLPPGIRIQRAFETRITGLPDAVRGACLLAATAFAPTSARSTPPASLSDLDPGALEGAEAAGIVRLTPERVEFAHPLLRGAAYAGATAAERGARTSPSPIRPRGLERLASGSRGDRPRSRRSPRRSRRPPSAPFTVELTAPPPTPSSEPHG